MPNITIVFSRHAELGKCNSNELYNIFEKIGPDVIFEEMPPSHFEDRYIFKNYRSLETVAIEKYIQDYNIPHIGVDSEEIPSELFFLEHRRLYEKVERLNDINGYTLKDYIDIIRINSESKGFEYLNTLQCQELYDNVNNSIENYVKKSKDEKLNRVLNSWNEVINMRENIMLKNIYTHCQNNKFENAVFTIGAAHRKSLLDKISFYDKTEQIKINWKLYGINANT